MSSEPVISVRGLGKSYTIAHNGARATTAGEAIMQRLRNPLARPQTETFWALKDVSFDINRGDVVGIIGRNGAGKSTLLKILSRITKPTTGEARLRGRVGSLLEVGTGFSGELTGRENIFLNGAILGMSRREIARQFDAIVDFSGTEQFLDTPVKRYSSGMYVRLAFAVAAHLEPEILIVDEVLAVGDAEFQKKCLGKMQDVAAHGRTVIFVSHNLEAVRKLCTRGVLMHKGQVQQVGPTKDVLDTYMQSGEDARSVFLIDPPQEDAPGYATSLAVENHRGVSIAEVPVGHFWQARVRFTINKRLNHFVIGLALLTPFDQPLRTSWSFPQAIEPGEYEAVFREDHIILEPGRYPFLVGLSEEERTIHFTEKAGSLQVAEVADFEQETSHVKITNCGFLLNQLDVSIQRSNTNVAVRQALSV